MNDDKQPPTAYMPVCVILGLMVSIILMVIVYQRSMDAIKAIHALIICLGICVGLPICASCTSRICTWLRRRKRPKASVS